MRRCTSRFGWGAARMIGVLIASALVCSAAASSAAASPPTVINTIKVGSDPYSVSSDGTHVWVANYGEDTVSEIEAATGKVINTIEVGSNPFGVSSDGTDVWVSKRPRRHRQRDRGCNRQSHQHDQSRQRPLRRVLGRHARLGRETPRRHRQRDR